MLEQEKTMSCQAGCWGLASIAGLVGAVVLRMVGGYGWFGVLFLGVLIAIILGVVFTRFFCTESGAAQQGSAEPSGIEAAARSAGAAVGKTAATVSDAAGSAAESVSNVVEGSEDIAESRDAPAAAMQPRGAVVQPSTRLAGQEELAERKGTWKYERPNDSGAAAKAAAAAATSVSAGTPVSEAAEASAESTPDYDGDGEHEGSAEGTRPAGLDGPRGGQADNLKEIKGIGPKLEKMLNGMGFYHFDQIASWGADEVAWVNANITGFKGRVSRDDWVAQAKVLAEGGETEFSKRVDQGGVY